DQWRTVTLARRARGLEAGRNPLAALSIFLGKLFALLVRAIRTGTLLATAMDARAFGTGTRSHARVSGWRTADTLLVVAGPLLLGGASGVTARLGTLRLRFGGAGRRGPRGRRTGGVPSPRSCPRIRTPRGGRTRRSPFRGTDRANRWRSP